MRMIPESALGAARLLAALSVLALAGCGGDGDAATGDTTSTTTNTATGVTAPASANTALVLVGAPPTEATSGSDYIFQPSVSGSPGTVVYAISGKPAWLNFDPNSGTLSGRPGDAQVGQSADIVITATAASATGSIGPFRIVVTTAALATPSAANVPPVISGTPPATAALNQTYDFTPTASDADNNSLSFSIVNRPAWASFSTTTGRLTGTPTAGSEGSYANIQIRVSDGFVTTALPAFSIQVPAAATASNSAASNGAPVIAGVPAATITAGALYTFTPTASDPNGDPLAFSVQNLPTWATFDTGTGRVLGTPSSTDVGSFANIVVSVSDGHVATALPAFRIDVMAPAVANSATGDAVLSWTPPTVNLDGTPLNDLVGYHIAYGTDPQNPTHFLTLDWAGYLWFHATQLAPGTWYFSISAYNAAGMESPAIVASKVIS